VTELDLKLSHVGSLLNATETPLASRLELFCMLSEIVLSLEANGICHRPPAVLVDATWAGWANTSPIIINRKIATVFTL
jgi:hypothetical protein